MAASANWRNQSQRVTALQSSNRWPALAPLAGDPPARFGRGFPDAVKALALLRSAAGGAELETRASARKRDVMPRERVSDDAVDRTFQLPLAARRVEAIAAMPGVRAGDERDERDQDEGCDALHGGPP